MRTSNLSFELLLCLAKRLKSNYPMSKYMYLSCWCFLKYQSLAYCYNWIVQQKILHFCVLSFHSRAFHRARILLHILFRYNTEFFHNLTYYLEPINPHRYNLQKKQYLIYVVFHSLLLNHRRKFRCNNHHLWIRRSHFREIRH